jgi:cation diffusion facilitator family transporter
MELHGLERWRHHHDFSMDHRPGERNTMRVIVITAVMMVAEIIAGIVYGSMALLADGWHMGTHVTAFGITVFAYRYARRHAASPNYSFGTGKVTVLGGFASAIVLAIVAVVMIFESVGRMFEPVSIRFNEALVVAGVGLAVNLVSALILQGTGSHEHPGAQGERHIDHDHNLRAAYFHVLADALTSVFAIVALLSGKLFGWVRMDPVMGIVGALVIIVWSYRLLRDTSAVLLDGDVPEEVRSAIRGTLEREDDNRVADLHVWRVGPKSLAATLCVVTHHPKPPEHYRQLLAGFRDLSHVTIEVNRCTDERCTGVADDGARAASDATTR